MSNGLEKTVELKGLEPFKKVQVKRRQDNILIKGNNRGHRDTPFVRHLPLI